MINYLTNINVQGTVTISDLLTANSDVLVGTNQIQLGTDSNDMEIFHTGNNGYIDMISGIFYIRNASNQNNFAFTQSGNFNLLGGVNASSLSTFNNITNTGTISSTNTISSDYGFNWTGGSIDWLMYQNAGSDDLFIRDLTNAEMSVKFNPSSVTIYKDLLVNQDITVSTGDITGNRLFSNNQATANNELVRLDQLNSIIGGLDWQESVLDQLNLVTSEPASPTVGDRYISLATGTSSQTSQAVTIHYIYEWNGTDWTEFIPNEGWTCWIEDVDTNYTYNGSTWVEFGSTVSHNNTTGLQGGQASQYYHLNLSDYTNLTTDSANIAYTNVNNNFSVSQTVNGILTVNNGNTNLVATFISTDNTAEIALMDGVTVDNTRVRLGAVGDAMTFRSAGVVNATLRSNLFDIGVPVDITGTLDVSGQIDALGIDVDSGGVRFKRTGYNQFHIRQSAGSGLQVFDETNSNTTAFFNNNAFAVNTTDTNGKNFRVNGTAEITGTLDVSDDITIIKQTGANLYINTNSGSYDASLYLTEGTNTSQVGAKIYYSGLSNEFRIASGTTTMSDRFIISRDSGAITMNGALAVNSVSNLNDSVTINKNGQALTLDGTDHVYIGFQKDSGARDAYFGFGSGSNSHFTLMSEVEGDLIFGTNSTQRYKISSAGVHTMTGTLDVSSTSSSTQHTATNNNTVAGVYDSIAYKFNEARGWGYNSADDSVFYNGAGGNIPFRATPTVVHLATTNITGTLDVTVTDSDRSVNIFAPNGENRFNLYAGGTGNSSYLQMYDHTGSTIGVQLNSAGISYINGTSLVLGGTVDGGYKFRVLGTSSLEGNTDITGSLDVSSNISTTNGFAQFVRNADATTPITLLKLENQFTGQNVVYEFKLGSSKELIIDGTSAVSKIISEQPVDITGTLDVSGRIDTDSDITFGSSTKRRLYSATNEVWLASGDNTSDMAVIGVSNTAPLFQQKVSGNWGTVQTLATQNWVETNFAELVGDNIAYTNVNNNFSVDQTITKNNATVSVIESGGADTKLRSGSIGVVGTYNDTNFRIVRNTNTIIDVLTTGVDITGSLNTSGNITAAGSYIRANNGTDYIQINSSAIDFKRAIGQVYMRPTTDSSLSLDLGQTVATTGMDLQWARVRVHTDGSDDFLWNGEIVATQDWVGDNVTEVDKALSLTLRVKNTESVALTKGQVVCAAPSATPPSGNIIEVKRADNNGTNSMPVIGILNEDLDAAGGANDEGEAIMFGRISGIDTSAFSVGDEVFVSDIAGGLTTTKPTGVKYIQKVGVVVRDSASNGTIEVFGAGRTNDVPTPLYVDHTNQRLGIGTDSPSFNLHVLGTEGGDGTYDGGILIENNNTSSDGEPTLAFRVNSMVSSNRYWFTGLNQSANYKIGYGTGFYDSDTFFTITETGNVGIGTTSPSSNLDIEDSNGVTIDINSSAGDGKFRFQDGGVIKWHVGRDNTNQNFAFSSGSGLGNGDVLTLATDGNVAIGTTPSTTHKFVVAGNIVSTNGKMYLSSGNQIYFDYSGSNDYAIRKSSSDLAFTSGGDFTFNSNIDIEDDSPFLTIRGTNSSYSNAGIQLISGNASNNRALGVFHYVENSDVEWFAGLPYGGNDAYVINRNTGYTSPSSQSSPVGIGASQGRLFTITNSGNVGIGTDTPDFKLDVAGDIGIDGKIYHNGDHNTYIGFGADTQTFRTAGVDALTIDSVQDVILTEDLRLSVNKVARFGGTHSIYFDGSNTYHQQTSGAMYYYNNADTHHTWHNNSTQRMRLEGTGTETDPVLLRIHGEGNNTNDDSKIILSQGDSGSDLEIFQTGVNTRTDGLTANDQYIRSGQRLNLWNRSNGSAWNTKIQLGYGYISFGTNAANSDASTRMIIDSSGNVGIGTTSPSSKLHIAYTGTGGTGIFGVGEGLKIQSLSPNITFDDTSNNIDSYAIHLNQSVFTLGRYTGSTSMDSDLVLKQGNVGIGTTSPTTNLDVRGGAIIAGSTPSAPIGTASTLEVYENGQDATLAIHQDNGASTTKFAQIRLRNGGNDTYIKTPTSGQALIVDTESLADAFVIETGGNVGIGTNNPSQKLDVSGNIKMTETAATSDTDKFVVLDSGVLKYRTGSQIVSDLPTDSRYVAVAGDTMTGSLNIGGGSASEYALQIGHGRTGDGHAYIDLVGDETYTNFGLRVIRGSSGANTYSGIIHRGDGNFELVSDDAGDIKLRADNGGNIIHDISGTNILTVDSTGVDISGTALFQEAVASGVANANLTIYNDTNGAGAGIKFSDQNTNQSQYGTFKFFHGDTSFAGVNNQVHWKFESNQGSALGLNLPTGGMYSIGSDIGIFQDGNNLFLRNSITDGDIFFQSDDGAGGNSTYYYIDGGNLLNRFTKSLMVEDNQQIIIGTGLDLTLFHESASSTTFLDINTNALKIRDASNVEKYRFNQNGNLQLDSISVLTGQQLVLNAGESAAQATGQGQTGEYVYLNAEYGLQINASPDNWATGWAGRVTHQFSANDVTLRANTTIIKDEPWFTLDSSSSGSNTVEQAAGISLGESGTKGNAAVHITYTGDGKGWLGMGTVTNAVPAYKGLTMKYNEQRVGIGGDYNGSYNVNINGTTNVTSNFTVAGTGTFNKAVHGNNISTTTSEGAYNITRTFTNSRTGSARAFADDTIWSSNVQSLGYAGWDNRAQFNNCTFNHHTAFQSRPRFDATTITDYEGVYIYGDYVHDSTITNWKGVIVDTPYTFDNTDITNFIGLEVKAAAGTNGASITNFYGLKIDTVNATNKWAIYSSNVDVDSWHRGEFSIGGTAPATADYDFQANKAVFKKPAYFEADYSTAVSTVFTLDVEKQVNELYLHAGNFSISNTISNISNTAGLIITIIIVQDSNGSRTITSWGTGIEFGDAGAPTLSTGANKMDMLSFYSDGYKLFFMGIQKGFSNYTIVTQV